MGTHAPAGPLPGLPAVTPIEALRKLISSPNHARKAMIWEQYDAQVLADTARTPGRGGPCPGAWHGETSRLHLGRDAPLCRGNPVEGGKQAVAEAFRNLVAVGATPLAATDNLNFGNPEKPAIMGQLVGPSKGSRGLPRAGVSHRLGQCQPLQRNDGQPILPTPTIGGVGLIRAGEKPILGPPRAGDVAILIGTTHGHLGQSALLAEEGIEAGDARMSTCAPNWRMAISCWPTADFIRAATDLSDGGLALAAFELAAEAGTGVTLAAHDIPRSSARIRARYLLAVDPGTAELLLANARAAAVPAQIVGHFGGDRIAFGHEDDSASALFTLWSGALQQRWPDPPLIAPDIPGGAGGWPPPLRPGAHAPRFGPSQRMPPDANHRRPDRQPASRRLSRRPRAC